MESLRNKSIEQYVRSLAFQPQEAQAIILKLQELEIEDAEQIQSRSMKQLQEIFGFSQKEAQILKNQPNVLEEPSNQAFKNKILELFPDIYINIFESIQRHNVKDYQQFQLNLDKLDLYQFQMKKIQQETSKQELFQFLDQQLNNQQKSNQLLAKLNKNGIYSIKDFNSLTQKDLQQLDLKSFEVKLLLQQKQQIQQKNKNQSQTFYHLKWGSNQIIKYDLESSNKSLISIDIVIPDKCQFIETNQNKIYCIGGGHKDSNYQNRNIEFDFVLQKASNKQQMNIKRQNTSLVYNKYKQSIYVIGGYNGNSIKDCEEYYIAENKWKTICNLNIPKHMSTSVLMNNKSIYNIGGQNQNNLQDIEKYNIEMDRWELLLIDKFSSLQKNHAMQSLKLGQNILIFGGYNSNQVQLINFQNNTIQDQNPLPENAGFDFNYYKKYQKKYYMLSFEKTLFEYDTQKNQFKIIQKNFY